jgi:hypothetical protein
MEYSRRLQRWMRSWFNSSVGPHDDRNGATNYPSLPLVAVAFTKLLCIDSSRTFCGCPRWSLGTFWKCFGFGHCATRAASATATAASSPAKTHRQSLAPTRARQNLPDPSREVSPWRQHSKSTRVPEVFNSFLSSLREQARGSHPARVVWLAKVLSFKRTQSLSL